MLKNEFESAMRRAGLSRGETAKRLGMSRSSLYRKLNGRTQFTLGEMVTAARLLALKDPKIFFNRKVS